MTPTTRPPFLRRLAVPLLAVPLLAAAGCGGEGDRSVEPAGPAPPPAAASGDDPVRGYPITWPGADDPPNPAGVVDPAGGFDRSAPFADRPPGVWFALQVGPPGRPGSPRADRPELDDPSAAAEPAPLELTVTVANLADGPVRVREPLLPGPQAPTVPEGEPVSDPYFGDPAVRVKATRWEHAPGPDAPVRDEEILTYWRPPDPPLRNEWGWAGGLDEEPPPPPPDPWEGERLGLGPDSRPLADLLTPAGLIAAAEPVRWTPLPAGERIVRRFPLTDLFRIDEPRWRYRFEILLRALDADGGAVPTRFAGEPGLWTNGGRKGVAAVSNYDRSRPPVPPIPWPPPESGSHVDPPEADGW